MHAPMSTLDLKSNIDIVLMIWYKNYHTFVRNYNFGVVVALWSNGGRPHAQSQTTVESESCSKRSSGAPFQMNHIFITITLTLSLTFYIKIATLLMVIITLALSSHLDRMVASPTLKVGQPWKVNLAARAVLLCAFSNETHFHWWKVM